MAFYGSYFKKVEVTLKIDQIHAKSLTDMGIYTYYIVPFESPSLH